MKRCCRTKLATLTLPLATEIQTSLPTLIQLYSEVITLVTEEDLCGSMALTYFVKNCLGLTWIYSAFKERRHF